MVYAKQASDMILGTLDKGLHVLVELAASPGAGMTLTELCTQVGMHRTTMFRILATLQARGFVSRDEDSGRYRLGLGVLVLASGLLRSLDIRQIARPILEELCRRTQELVYLTVLDDGDVITVEAFDSDQLISLRAAIGDRRPAYCTASGKAILAYLPDDDVDQILARGMPALTQRTITSPVVMHHHLAEIRKRGFASDDEERMEGLRCVAAPIRNLEGAVLGSTSIAVQMMRASLPRLDELGHEIAIADGKISRQLGYTSAERPNRDGHQGQIG
jgi:IclR family transcriptional regulator, KDG regulon repressor